jgi:hypothetical protein
MTYEAKLTIKFDSKFTHSPYSSYETDSVPEEHYTFEVPAQDLNTTQMFGLFRKVMLTMGYCEQSIASGMMSTVFNPDGDEKLMRKMCEEYDLTMNEDVFKKVDEEVKKQLEIEKELNSKKGPMGTVLDDNMPPWGHSDMEALSKHHVISDERDRFKQLYFNSVEKLRKLQHEIDQLKQPQKTKEAIHDA